MVFRTTPLLVLAGLASGLLCPGIAAAQRGSSPKRPPEPKPEEVADFFAAVLHPSEEATTLLSRANEGASRQDWKLVVDSLQRIIELPGDHILATHEGKYESARLHAQRQLAALPPEGLRTYRLIYDGEAAALFDQAVAQHDEAGLRRLVDRSFLTSKGDDAAVTLADWLIDEGRFLEACVYLRMVQTIYPDSDLPAWAVPARLAVCLAGMDRPERAEAALQELSSKFPDSSSPEVAARIAQIREFLNHAAVPEARPVELGWPMAYGRSSRDGYMSPIEPTFISHLPWNVPLPVPPPKSGTRPMEEYAESRQLMPVADIATDGQVIVVKSGANLMGLDRDTFDPLWSTRNEEEQSDLVDLEPNSPRPGWPVSPTIDRPAEDRFTTSPQFRRLYHDSVGNEVCLAAGLAVTVEWPGEPPDTLSTRTNRVARRQAMPMAGTAQSNPNFVVAYSAADGHRVWTSDTTSGPNALGQVEFLAAPITVDNLFLAPARVNDDMYAVLLDPQTGKIARSIYLCGTGGAPFDSLYACMPCVADGIVFVPTGRGVLVAIDVSSWSIRWAVRYDQVSRPVNDMTWQPTPVIAVSDVVILAPPDADELFCFDRATGDLRWHAPRQNAAYVLAADNTRVWAVGEEVYALDLEAGKRMWSRQCGVPAGRGALAGDRLYVPTQSGMYVLNAASGEPLEERPVNVPAGNLLAYEDSLYVASAFEIRKYPDMKRGYDQAVAAQAKDPANLSLSMRLAWLEYLRDEPAKALAALSQVPDTLRSQDEKRYGRMVHLKVLAMLELASAPDTNAEAALKLLREAQQISQTVEDSITARLALGQYHERAQGDGSVLHACLEYAALALDSTGDQMMSEDGDTYERKAGLMASRRLADLLPKLSVPQTAELTESLRGRLSQAIKTHNVAQLRRISNCSALARLGVEADLALGVWAARDLAYEQAEACLQRVIDRAESPELVAEALARLAVIYLQPGELQLPVAGKRLLGRLDKDFPVVQIPATILDTEWPGPAGSGAISERRIDAREAVRALRKRVDETIETAHKDALGRIVLGATGKSPSTNAYANARPIVIRGSRPEPLADRMLMFVEDRTVEARRADNSELLWPAELRLLGEMAVESQTVNETTRFTPRISPSEPARGLACGQTLMINTRFGIHAVGLLTGRRLWSRRFDPPPAADRSVAGSDACIWTHNGYVISVDSFGRLEVARCETGADILWRRRILDRQWQTVRAIGDFLVVGDAALEHVDVFRLSDGTHLGVCEFAQQAEADKAVNIAVADNIICGPISPREVAARELSAPGLDPRWKVQMKSELSQVFKPTEDTIAIADRAGRIKLIDPRDGSVKLDVQVPACASGVVDGRIDSDVLYVYGLEKRFDPSRPTTERQQWSVAAIRVSNGEILWSRTDLGPQLCVTGEALTASSNGIPVLAYRPVSGEARIDYGNGPVPVTTGRRAKVELLILDKATGANIGEPAGVEVESMDGSAMLLDLQVWPGRVTAFVGTNLLRFDLLPAGERAIPSPPGGENNHPSPGS